MSVIEFFDVFRMFLGELDNRDYNPEQRGAILQHVITSLKDVLASVEMLQAEDPYQQQMYQQAPQGYQQPPQQYEQQYNAPPQNYAPQQQNYQQPAYQAPPAQQAPAAAPPQAKGMTHNQMMSSSVMPAAPDPNAGKSPDAIALASISSIVYGTGLKLQNVFKAMNVDGEGVTEQQLVDGLAKLGVKLPPQVILRLAAPYMDRGRLKYSGFIRMLGGGQDG